jgi:hypothetical protein
MGIIEPNVTRRGVDPPTTAYISLSYTGQNSDYGKYSCNGFHVRK